MTADDDDAVRDLVRQAYEVSSEPSEFDVREGLREVLERAHAQEQLACTGAAAQARAAEGLQTSSRPVRSRAPGGGLRPGERLGGRFLLTEPLVSDNDARRRVWRARDEKMSRDVVLKDVGGTGRAPGYAPGEVRAHAQAGHPHVISVYELVELRDEGSHDGDWVVLEYAPGGSLAGTLMAPAQAAMVGAHIASALVHLHGHGIVHGDIKPGNIVRAGDGTAKLTDFGSAYRTHAEATVSPPGPLSYTPGYAPPEVGYRRRPVPASDVYSLAATVHALVTGTPPQRPVADLPAMGPLGTALAAMLREDPADRPDAAEALRLLRAVADGADPAGATTDAPTIPPRPARPAVVPAQLPADVPGFAGRAAELDQLDRLVSLAPSTVMISAISGTAGVGKTALALHWAHRVADRFPDGQLYVNLRGFDPTGQALGPAEAIRGFLDALGVPPERVPADTEAQTGLYRSMLAGRRVLVVLDNARDTNQILPLLPGAPGCLVLITSRNDLLDLISQHGAYPLELPVLDEPDAWQLLDHRLGTDRTVAEPDAVNAIITAGAGLPLALALVAARAATRPRFPLATFATELRDSHTRLGALTGERPDTDVYAVFSWSYNQLTPAARRLFRLLGLHPGPDLSALAAASLAGLPPADVAPLLAELTRTHLLAEHRPGRYTFHDLLRAYAGDLARTTDTDDDRHAATERLLDHYLHTAYTADRLIYPQRSGVTLTGPRPGVTTEQLVDREQATDWFRTEHHVLLAAVAHAGATGFNTHVWQLTWSIDTYLDRQGHWRDLTSIWDLALEAARRLGDRIAEGQALISGAYFRLDQFSDSLAYLDRALALWRELGDLHRQGHVLQIRGRLYERQGLHADALDAHHSALKLYRATGKLAHQAEVLNEIGWDYAQLGQPQIALTYCEQALNLFQDLGEDFGESATWDSLGYAYHLLGQFENAISSYQRALDLRRDLSSRLGEAGTLNRLGDTHYAASDPRSASRSWRAALAIFDELGHPDADAVRAKLEQLDQPPTAGPDNS